MMLPRTAVHWLRSAEVWAKFGVEQLRLVLVKFFPLSGIIFMFSNDIVKDKTKHILQGKIKRRQEALTYNFNCFVVYYEFKTDSQLLNPKLSPNFR